MSPGGLKLPAPRVTQPSQFGRVAVLYGGTSAEREILDAVALVEIAGDDDLVGLHAEHRLVADHAGVVLHLEQDVDLLVLAEDADRHAAARAPDGAAVMGRAFGPHDFAQVAPGIDDLAGHRDPLRLRRRRCRLRGDGAERDRPGSQAGGRKSRQSHVLGPCVAVLVRRLSARWSRAAPCRDIGRHGTDLKPRDRPPSQTRTLAKTPCPGHRSGEHGHATFRERARVTRRGSTA